MVNLPLIQKGYIKIDNNIKPQQTIQVSLLATAIVRISNAALGMETKIAPTSPPGISTGLSMLGYLYLSHKNAANSKINVTQLRKLSRTTMVSKFPKYAITVVVKAWMDRATIGDPNLFHS
jgi:hypothetical protein